MKKHILVLFVFAFFSITFSACKKNKDSTPTVSSMQALVDGNLFVCDSILKADTNLYGNLYTFSGNQKD